MDVEKRLEKYFKSLAKDENITVKEAKEIICSDWGKDGLRGYGIFVNDFLPNIQVIERIDEMDIYDSDIDAGIQAKKDFENGIFDYDIIGTDFKIPNIYPLNCYKFIDTLENRNLILKYIEENEYAK